MGKGDRRRRNHDLPQLAPVPRKVRDGNSTRRPRLRSVTVETGADLVGLLARARHMGEEIKSETTRDGRRNKANIEHNARVLAEMKLTGYETPATAAISIARQGEQRLALLNAWWGLTAAERNYHLLAFGQTCDAKTTNMTLAPDKMETSADHPPPKITREEAEAARAAANKWAIWRGMVMQLPSHLARSIMDAMHGEWELHRVETSRDGKRDAILTARGRRFVEAVEALARVVEGKK